MKKYKWIASVNSPSMYPIMVHKSILIYKNGYTYLESGYCFAGEWGGTGSKNHTDTKEKAVPYRLVLSWLSWAESKFYTGIFDLPTQKIENYFKEGYINYKGQWETYSIILVGMAPEGVVVLWLLGGSSCVEISRFQANETKEISVKDIAPGANGLWGEYPSIDELSKQILDPEIKENLIRNGLGNHIWDTYRERFMFRNIIEGKVNNIVVNKVCQEFYNGENKWLTLSEINAPYYSMQARIKRITFDWFDGEDNYSTDIVFNEKEILRSYEQIYKNNTSQKGELIIQFSNSFDIRIYLRNEGDIDTLYNEIMLHKSVISVCKLGE